MSRLTTSAETPKNFTRSSSSSKIGSRRSPDHDVVLVGLALDSDTDDGFSDGQEDTNHNGAIDGAESDPNNAASTPQAVQKVPFILGLALVLLACVLTVMMARRQRR